MMKRLVFYVGLSTSVFIFILLVGVSAVIRIGVKGNPLQVWEQAAYQLCRTGVGGVPCWSFVIDNHYGIAVDAVLNCDRGLSPDRKQHVVSRGDYYKSYNLYVLSNDGKREIPITMSSQNVIDFHAVWSPNSRYIAFRRYEFVPSGVKYGVMIVTRLGEYLRQLTESGLYFDAPAWSPDSTIIAHAIGFDSVSRGIELIDIISEERSMLTNYGISPAWSPNGHSIMFINDMTWTYNRIDITTGQTDVFSKFPQKVHPHFIIRENIWVDPLRDDCFIEPVRYDLLYMRTLRPLR